jgi:hypothetical protein
MGWAIFFSFGRREGDRDDLIASPFFTGRLGIVGVIQLGNISLNGFFSTLFERHCGSLRAKPVSLLKSRLCLPSLRLGRLSSPGIVRGIRCGNFQGGVMARK